MLLENRVSRGLPVLAFEERIDQLKGVFSITVFSGSALPKKMVMLMDLVTSDCIKCGHKNTPVKCLKYTFLKKLLIKPFS